MIFFNNQCSLDLRDFQKDNPIMARKSFLVAEVEKVAEKMGLKLTSDESKKIFISYDRGLAASLGQNYYFLNPLFVADFNDIPKDLNFKGSLDERLGDLEFVQDLYQHLMKSDNPITNEKPVNWEDAFNLIFFLKLKENKPDLAHSVFESIVGHEMGHDFYQDYNNYYNNKIKLIKITMLFIGVFSAFTCLFTTALIVIKISAILLSGVAGVGGFFLADKFYMRQTEYRADTFAALRLPDYYKIQKHAFSCAEEALVRVKFLKPKLPERTQLNFIYRNFKIIKQAILNNSILHTHPSPSSRLKNIRKVNKPIV